MSACSLSLSTNGKRKYTRGWRGAHYVKRQTAKRARRMVRESLRSCEGDTLYAHTKGYVS